MWQRHKAERGVWSRGMLEALERGVKGGKWFSLIDKVYADKTLVVGWEKVKSNAGACGVDGITIERFEKQAEERLLAVKEQIERGDFDAIPHDRLMEQVGKHIADGRVLGMIEGFLKAGVMEGMENWEPEEGTPQGGVI